VRAFQGNAFAKINLAGAYHWLGDWTSARRELEECLQLPLSDVMRRNAESDLRYLNGDLEGALELVQQQRAAVRASGDEQAIWNVAGEAIRLLLALGRTSEALDAAREAAGVTEREAYLLFASTTYILEALARGGDHQQCEELSARADEVGRAAGSFLGAFMSTFGRGVSALEQGKLDDAVRLLEEAVPLAARRGPALHAHVLIVAAEAHRRRGGPGDTARGKELLQASLGLLDQMGDRRSADEMRKELQMDAQPRRPLS